MIEVDEGVGGPESSAELLTGDESAGRGEKNREDVEGLAAEFKTDAVLEEFASVQVGLKGAKAKSIGAIVGHRNRGVGGQTNPTGGTKE